MTSEGNGQKLAVTAEPGPLTSAEAQILDAYWRAANYLSAGQIYLMANPLLAEPLRVDHIKPRLLGHWGTSPGLNFIWAHLSRVITARRTEMMIVIGPGHGGPAARSGTPRSSCPPARCWPAPRGRRGRAR